MSFPSLCAPALIYGLLTVIALFFDVAEEHINTALMRGLSAAVMVLLLQLLCDRGYEIAAWVLVFLPFLFMTYVIGVLLWVFGLDVATGQLTKIPPQTAVTYPYPPPPGNTASTPAYQSGI